MVGTPYHNVCPASFFMPLKGFEYLALSVSGLDKSRYCIVKKRKMTGIMHSALPLFATYACLFIVKDLLKLGGRLLPLPVSLQAKMML